MIRFCILTFCAVLLSTVPCRGEKKVLVYTRNFTPDGKGYVHENIADSVKAIQKMGSENGFAVDVSDDPTSFTAENLKKYRAVIFSNTNNEAFQNDSQRAAFQQFVQRGGGLVGIHSATGSERTWPMYWFIIGGKFDRHPPLQKFTVRVADHNHPATKFLPDTFEWEDECYFHDFLNPDLHALLVTDPKKLKDEKAPVKRSFDLVGNSLPLAWTHEVGSGRVFYTALGHKREYYGTPLLYKHVLGGILWVLEDRP